MNSVPIPLLDELEAMAERIGRVLPRLSEPNDPPMEEWLVQYGVLAGELEEWLAGVWARQLDRPRRRQFCRALLLRHVSEERPHLCFRFSCEITSYRLGSMRPPDRLLHRLMNKVRRLVLHPDHGFWFVLAFHYLHCMVVLLWLRQRAYQVRVEKYPYLVAMDRDHQQVMNWIKSTLRGEEWFENQNEPLTAEVIQAIHLAEDIFFQLFVPHR